MELKAIYRIQKEYLNLLTYNLALVSNLESSDIKLTYFFEEVSLFWRKRFEIINFFLNKIEVDDKCSFLAGAMYIDLINYGHYEFSSCGNFHIFTDPVTKMRTLFSKDTKGIDNLRAKEYLKKVIVDCIEVLTNYSEVFIVLPLNDIFLEDQEERNKFLMESSFLVVSSLFENPCNTEKEFIKKYHSIEEIEQDIKPELMDKFIFSDRYDLRLSLRERIENNLNEIFELEFLKQKLNEAEIFIMAVGQFSMQAMDIILISYSYKLIPFIRSEVVFNYLYIFYPIFNEDKIMVRLLEQTTVAYLFTKIYRTESFSKIEFSIFYNNVQGNKIIDEVIKISRIKEDCIFKLEVNQVASIIEEVYTKLFSI